MFIFRNKKYYKYRTCYKGLYKIIKTRNNGTIALLMGSRTYGINIWIIKHYILEDFCDNFISLHGQKYTHIYTYTYLFTYLYIK